MDPKQEFLSGLATYFRDGQALAQEPSKERGLGRYMVPAGAEEKLRQMQEADHLRNLYEQELEAARARQALEAEQAGYRQVPRQPAQSPPPSNFVPTGYKKY